MEGPSDFSKQSNVNTCTYVCICVYTYIYIYMYSSLSHRTCDVIPGFRASVVRGNVQLRIIGLSKRGQTQNLNLNLLGGNYNYK